MISSCAFDLKADSLHNPDSEFRKKVKAIFTPSVVQRFRQLLVILSSTWLFRLFRFKTTPQHLTDFFMNLVRDTIEYRTKHGIERKDFLDILLNAQEDGKEQVKNYGEYMKEVLKIMGDAKIEDIHFFLVTTHSKLWT